MLAAPVIGRLVLKAHQLGFTFGPRKAVQEPGLRGSTKWYRNERGEVVYGERPVPPPHPTPTPPAVVPQLGVRFGASTQLQAVQSLAEASTLWQAYRDLHALGASQSPKVTVVDYATGKTVAEISYNGRVWGPGGYPNAPLLHDPRPPVPPPPPPPVAATAGPTCPNCHGTGEVTRTIPLGRGRKETLRSHCDGCDGKGTLPPGSLTLEDAQAMGAAARDRGVRAAPMLDAELMKRLPPQGVGPLLQAWSKGWHQRNLSGDAPDFPDYAAGDKVMIHLGDMQDSRGNVTSFGWERATVRSFADGKLHYADAKGGGGFLRPDGTNVRKGWDEAPAPPPEPVRPPLTLTGDPPPPSTQRPKDAKTYADDPRAQPWEVLRADYIARTVERKAKLAHDQAESWTKTAAGERPGTKKHRDAEWQATWWTRDAAKFDAQDPEHMERARRDANLQYVKLVKDAISKGRLVPLPVIRQSIEFQKVYDGRLRYEKGRHTSFANVSAAVDNSMQDARGFKVKRQDGKAMKTSQREDILRGVSEVEEVIGPLADVMRKTDLTIAHTNGKHPFMRGDAGGLYSSGDRTVSVGIGMMNGKAIPALAHELGHWLDFEAGRALGKEARSYRRSGKAVRSTSLAEADVRDYIGQNPGRGLIRRATDSINHTLAVTGLLAKKLTTLTKNGANLEQKVEVERAKVSLGPYWRDPCEVWARLVEQYVATKRGTGGWSHDTPEYYGNRPGWWMPEIFHEFIPDIERELKRRIEAIQGK